MTGRAYEVHIRAVDERAFSVFARGHEFLLASGSVFHSTHHVEGAVRLGDAPTVELCLSDGAQPQGRAEVRFLTFPLTLTRFFA
jgi:hypothetical protein